jgi:hypothetical protein
MARRKHESVEENTKEKAGSVREKRRTAVDNVFGSISRVRVFSDDGSSIERQKNKVGDQEVRRIPAELLRLPSPLSSHEKRRQKDTTLTLSDIRSILPSQFQPHRLEHRRTLRVGSGEGGGLFDAFAVLDRAGEGDEGHEGVRDEVIRLRGVEVQCLWQRRRRRWRGNRSRGPKVQSALERERERDCSTECL